MTHFNEFLLLELDHESVGIERVEIPGLIELAADSKHENVLIPIRKIGHRHHTQLKLFIVDLFLDILLDGVNNKLVTNSDSDVFSIRHFYVHEKGPSFNVVIPLFWVLRLIT